jgi:hypothetical protein
MWFHDQLSPVYGNTGCGVFKRGDKFRKILPKNPHTRRKILSFEDWTNGERIWKIPQPVLP